MFVDQKDGQSIIFIFDILTRIGSYFLCVDIERELSILLFIVIHHKKVEENEEEEEEEETISELSYDLLLEMNGCNLMTHSTHNTSSKGHC